MRRTMPCRPYVETRFPVVEAAFSEFIQVWRNSIVCLRLQLPLRQQHLVTRSCSFLLLVCLASPNNVPWTAASSRYHGEKAACTCHLLPATSASGCHGGAKLHQHRMRWEHISAGRRLIRWVSESMSVDRSRVKLIQEMQG